MRFKEKVVLITGGNSGIGKATALAFAREGAHVVIADIAEKMDAPLAESMIYIRTDVTQFSEVENMVATAIQAFGTVDVLVNSAGISGARARTDEYPEDAFDKVMNINVKGTWFGMKAVLPHFFAKKSGTIVNIASMAGHIVMAGHIAYTASKHAVLGMTKTTAVEFAKYGIRVNAVCPGFTHTPMFDDLDTPDNVREALRQAIPMKRFGQPEEIASAILYLASDESSFVTGTGMILDGGLGLQ